MARLGLRANGSYHVQWARRNAENVSPFLFTVSHDPPSVRRFSFSAALLPFCERGCQAEMVVTSS